MSEQARQSKAANLIGIILCALILPVAALNTTLAVKSYLRPGKVAMVFGYGPLIVETGSMRPEFKENDVIIARECDAGVLEKDAVIAFYDANGTVVSHRVIGWGADESGARLYTTKGDANNVQDRDPVPAAQVVGRIVRVIPDGGKVMRIIGQPLVTILLIGVPLGLLFGYDALRKALANKKGKEVAPDVDEPRPEE